MCNEPLGGFDSRHGTLGGEGRVGTRLIIGKRLKIVSARQKSSQLGINTEIIFG